MRRHGGVALCGASARVEGVTVRGGNTAFLNADVLSFKDAARDRNIEVMSDATFTPA